jgi:hypothetical protein
MKTENTSAEKRPDSSTDDETDDPRREHDEWWSR